MKTSTFCIVYYRKIYSAMIKFQTAKYTSYWSQTGINEGRTRAYIIFKSFVWNNTNFSQGKW